jgi:hypothetical protein
LNFYPNTKGVNQSIPPHVFERIFKAIVNFDVGYLVAMGFAGTIRILWDEEDY